MGAYSKYAAKNAEGAIIPHNASAV